MTEEAIRKKLVDAIDLKGEAKLQALRELWKELATIEKVAASDFSIPLLEIRTVRILLPDVGAEINRLESARKARAGGK